MNKGLFVFLLSVSITAIVVAVGIGLNWVGFPAKTASVSSQTTFTAAEVRKIIDDWPIAMLEVDRALTEYRAIGTSSSGETVVRIGAQTRAFRRLGWPEGRAEYLISYLYMLRNALLKNTDQHRALVYFTEHYKRNQAVSEEIKASQIEQISIFLKQINEAPEIGEFPPGDVELMTHYFQSFHDMLVGYGNQPPMMQR